VKATEAVWCVDTDPATAAQRPVDTHAAAPADLSGATGAGAGGGATLSLTLEKVAPTWWRRALEGPGHPEIDATLVDSTVPLTDYDDETQGAIRRIMYNQAQKAAGLPTSEEEAAARLLGSASTGGGDPPQRLGLGAGGTE
jgi:hypothetical protein